MSATGTRHKRAGKGRERLKKSERRKQILLELKLSPHVRISELAQRFNVSTETVRRDFDALAGDGLVARAHGGASAPAQGAYPGLQERASARKAEREGIGQGAAALIRDGETVMIDSGSTTVEMARALAYRGTSCTVITNSIPVAMTLGQGAGEVILCPGEYLAAESAVIGADTLEFLGRFNVDHCVVGASGISAEGISETVRGFAAVKRVMLDRAARRHLLIDSQKFECRGLAQVCRISDLTTIVVDAAPAGALLAAMTGASVDLLVAEPE